MGLRDRYDFDSLVNEAERLVLAELDAQLVRLGARDSRPVSRGAGAPCACQDCVLDMAAYALNRVPPSYRVSLMGSFASRPGDDPAYAREVARAVREAIDAVRANPSHD
jgi:competence protein ComFB